MFDVLESCQTFPFYRPTANVWAIQLFYVFMTLVFLIIAILVVRKRYLVVLICIFLAVTDVDHFFHVPFGHLYIFFEKYLVKSFACVLSFVFSILNCKSSLCILDRSPLSYRGFANIFTFLLVTFEVHKTLILMKSSFLLLLLLLFCHS